MQPQSVFLPCGLLTSNCLESPLPSPTLPAERRVQAVAGWQQRRRVLTRGCLLERSGVLSEHRHVQVAKV
jgi:hypothetical protein